jgi:hypothetical protein
VAVTRARATRLENEVGYFDLVADLAKIGCPACHGANRAVWRYLDSLLWEFVNDPGVRGRLRASLGFCREHAITMLAVANKQAASLGVAILYDDLLRAASRVLPSEAPKRRRRGGRSTPTLQRCKACEIGERVASDYLSVLAKAPDGSAPWKGIRRHGRGLCLRHVLQGLDEASDEEQWARLRDAFRRGEEELREHLAGFIRKHDYRYAAEPVSELEGSSPRRAVFRLIGEPPPHRAPER